jgi:Flp pilus assembly protein TadD
MAHRIFVIGMGLVIAACTQTQSDAVIGSVGTGVHQNDVTGSVTRPKPPNVADGNKPKPPDARAAIAYARALRERGDAVQAMAHLDETAQVWPADRALIKERGLLALELGKMHKAEELLQQAQDPSAPDWRVHSALGTVLANRGQQREAQAQFARALALAPDHPAILNNLALSYALDGKAREAEELLRKAEKNPGSKPQVRQNLALVLGLGGKYDEAERVAAAVLPPAKASANVGYLRMLAEARVASTGEVAQGAELPAPAYQLGGPQLNR